MPTNWALNIQSHLASYLSQKQTFRRWSSDNRLIRHARISTNGIDKLKWYNPTKLGYNSHFDYKVPQLGYTLKHSSVELCVIVQLKGLYYERSK